MVVDNLKMDLRLLKKDFTVLKSLFAPAKNVFPGGSVSL